MTRGGDFLRVCQCVHNVDFVLIAAALGHQPARGDVRMWQSLQRLLVDAQGPHPRLKCQLKSGCSY